MNDLPEFKNIFLNFYNDSINKLPSKDQHNANRLIEDELIRSKQRISLDENICKEYIDEHQLKALVDTHLLRAEQNSFGRFSFELSHDTLIEPILESQKKYKDEQEKIALEKEQEEKQRIFLEKQAQLEKDRQKKLRIQRIISLIVTLFLLVSIGLVFLAFSSNRIAQEQKTKAIISQQKAVNYFITNTKQEIQKSKDNAFNLIGDNDYEDAINNFEKAKQVINSLSADSIISNEKSKKNDVAGGIFSFFQSVISSVDNEKNTVVSLETFNDTTIQTISRIKRDTIEINNSIKKVREKIDADVIIGQYKNRAMALRKSLKYREALQVYNEALKKDKDRNDVIKEYNSILAEAIVAYQSLVAFYQDEVKNKDKAAWAASRLLDFQNMKPKEER